MTTTTPIKRIPAFVSFSREHHFELLLVWKIRQGLKKNISTRRISEYIRSVHLESLEKHFRNEEVLLWNIVPAKDKLRNRAEAEHAAIRDLLVQVKNGLSNSVLLQQLADALEAHIRFEERVLFNHLQQQLPEDQGFSIADREIVANKFIDEQWEDPFWNHK